LSLNNGVATSTSLKEQLLEVLRAINLIVIDMEVHTFADLMIIY
jgi:galactitol-specific phosphotransferase system IIB component